MCGLLKADFVHHVCSTGASGGAVMFMSVRALCVQEFEPLLCDLLLRMDSCEFVSESMVTTLKATYENTGMCVCCVKLNGEI